MSRRKVISYALFGWGKEQNKDCFDFETQEHTLTHQDIEVLKDDN